MIPFEVDPMLYFPSILCLIGAIIFLCLHFKYGGDSVSSLFIVFFIFCCCAWSLVFVSGSIYTDTITICEHTSDRSIMTVIDTNQNTYYVKDLITEFKVKNGETLKMKIEDTIFGKYIYSIDAPITCGNQTCGVTS